MNGKKLMVIGLALVCALSLAGNLFLYQQNKSLTAQLTEQAAKAQELTQQVEDYHAQISSLQAQLEALQASYETQNMDTPQTAETEQSTQGAASNAAQETEYAQQQQQAKPTPPPAQSSQAPSKPTTKPPASSSVQNPSASDVNDLLNEVLGGGSSKPNTPSKPSGSSGGGYVESPGADGSGLGTGGSNNLDAWK